MVGLCPCIMFCGVSGKLGFVQAYCSKGGKLVLYMFQC